jgi:deoxyribonuclease-4
VHVSIAGGLTRAVERAEALACETMQIFSKTPRGWAAHPLDPHDVTQARRLREQFAIRPLAVHASYLINLASEQPELYQKSISALIEELERCRVMAADFLVLHVGCVREGQRNGIARVAAALKQALRQCQGTEFPTVLLENTAGERGEPGSRFEELAEMLDRVGSDRLAVCLDTCHALAAGYDISSVSGVKATLKTIDRTIGLASIKFIHANDSKKGLNCRVDRHQHIGEGCIGVEGFRALLASRLRVVPLVLETPKLSERDDVRNLQQIRRLAT